MNNFFVTGGTMKPDAPSYILRAADEELFHALLNSEFCSVLTTRQMGKSSLMARTAARLREQGVQCAVLDLQGKGDLKSPPEQWYYGVVKQIATGLNLAGDWAEWWKQQSLLLPAQRMTDFFADIVLKQIAGPIVVFIDEVDWMIRMRFSDEFFAAIRSCYNRPRHRAGVQPSQLRPAGISGPRPAHQEPHAHPLQHRSRHRTRRFHCGRSEDTCSGPRRKRRSDSLPHLVLDRRPSLPHADALRQGHRAKA